jgi:hypothetical protein
MIRTAQSPAGAGKRATSRWRRIGALAAVLVAVAAPVAACSGGGSPDATSSSLNGTSVQSSARQSGINYASCMRADGVRNFPDSAISVNDGQVEFDVPGYLKSEPQFPAASRACQRDLPGGVVSAKHVNLHEQLEFARCMRSHGITDFPDPMPGGGWDIPGDTNSPQFVAAAHACQATGIHWNRS